MGIMRRLPPARAGRRPRASSLIPLWVVFASLTMTPAAAQQFNSDNQWVAPHGVATLMLTVGQEYSTALAVAALLPDTEFNFGVTRFEPGTEDPGRTHYSMILYVKRRLSENEAGNGGWAVMGGTGVDKSYLGEGEHTETFRTWWANAVYTIPLFDGKITWDLLPGAMVNLDHQQSGNTAWGMTWSSRAAFYNPIPHTPIVAEVFGTIGEAYAEPSYRVGPRWEGSRVIVAATYGDSFTGAGSPRFELGVLVLTNQLKFLCWGTCRKDPNW